MDTENNARIRLRNGILNIAVELGMDATLTSNCTDDMGKEELLEWFCKLKTQRLEKENERLIGFLIS